MATGAPFRFFRRPMLLAVIGYALLMLWTGCSPRKRYEVLSFFFDGVPDPDRPNAARVMPGQRQPALVYSHKPYADGDCKACHTGGMNSVFETTSNLEINPRVCIKCHEKVLAEYPIMHGPVSASECLRCHAPHESNSPALLAGPSPGICVQCHVPALLGPKPPEHLNPKVNCFDCHVGHGSQRHGLLRTRLNDSPLNPACPAGNHDGPHQRKATAMRRPPDMILRYAMLVAFAVALAARRAQAQPAPEGQITFGAKRTMPAFNLERPYGYVDLNAQYANDRIDSPNSPENVSRDTMLQETIGLSTTGYIVHPNLVDLRLAGSFGLTQEWSSGTQPDNYSNGTIYTWDLSATMLRGQTAPLTLYTDRSVTLVDQTFGPTLRDTQTTYGAGMQIRSQSVPTWFRIYHRDESQTESGTGADNFSLSTNVFQWHSEARPTENQTLVWDYEYDQTDQEGFAGVNGTTDSNSASLGHSWVFGPQKNYTLSSSVTYTDSTGLFPYSRLRWDELLRAIYSPNFETNLEYSLDWQDAFDIQQTLQRSSAGFRHQLYRSLTTTGRIGWNGLTLSDGSSSTDYFASLATDYRKSVPFGTLHLNGGVDYEYLENSARTDTTQIIDQGFTLVDFQPYRVNQRGAVPASVVVRDLNGRIFTPELDYTVEPTGEGMQITRLAGGAIPDGGPLLLNYDIGALPGYSITTTGFDLGGRYDIEQGLLRGFSPYGSIHVSNQSVSGGAGQIVPDDVRGYIYGIQYRIGDLEIQAEHEIYDSTLFPYDARRLIARYNSRVSFDTTVGLTAGYTTTTYPEQDNRTDVMLVSGSISHNLARGLFITAALTWLNLDDEIAGRTQGLQEYVELHWYIRQSELYARARNSSLDSASQDSDFQFFELGIRRSF